MGTHIRKELYLEGLECNYCSARIGEEAKLIEGVKNTFMDHNTRTLMIEAENEESVDHVIDKVNEIIARHEHEIDIKEKIVSRSEKKVLLMMGLSCVNCAAGIEKAVSGIKGVKSAAVDFTSGKMTIEAGNKSDLGRIVREATKISSEIEDGIKLIDEGAENSIDGKIKNRERLKIARVGIATLLFLPLIIFELPVQTRFLIYMICYLLAGYDVVLRALKNLLKGKVFDENFLMSIATVGAFLIKQYPEAVAVMLFYQTGSFIQEKAVNRSRRSIKTLMSIRPDYANLVIDGETSKVLPSEIKVGDTINVKPGERIPLDGTVTNGSSVLDVSALTGESLPRDVGPGAEVLSGSINISGTIWIEVKKEFGESTISKILDLVQNAGRKKAPVENFITRFAAVYTPAVVFAAVLLAVIPPLVMRGESFSEWINRALVFLVASCPCALVISIPLSFFMGIGEASKNGILVKGSNYLEALNNIDCAVFDKTGTLTKGVFKVHETNCTEGTTEDSLLENAAYAESYSNHPIALSIKEAYGVKIDRKSIERFDEIYGYGISAKVDGREILAGNMRLMEKENIDAPENTADGTVVYIAKDGSYIGNIVITDEIRKDSLSTIEGMRKAGVKRLVMLTGDNARTGDAIGKKLGFDEIYTELLPYQKVEILEDLEAKKTTKGKILFVGDGINDAPVLTRADIGIAMNAEGLGSDAAIEAADIVIMKNEPSKLLTAIRIAKKTQKTVRQNILFALSIKALVLLLGAAGIATMGEAVFADVGVTLIAIMNSMRIRHS